MKPGGSIAYVTCSVFPSENRDQINAFLERHPDFESADHVRLWGDRFPAHAGLARAGASGIVLSPALSGTDGFFFSALRRRG